MRWDVCAAALLIGLFAEQPLFSQPPTAGRPAVGLLGPGLQTRDLARSIKFYTDGLGLTVMTRLQLNTAEEVVLSFSGDPSPPLLFLLQSRNKAVALAARKPESHEKIVLSVSDADSLASRLKAAGYAPTDVKTNSVNQMKVFWVNDPDGYALEIVEMPGRQPQGSHQGGTN